MAAPYTTYPGTPMKLLDAVSTGTGGPILPRGEIARMTVVLQSSAQLTTGSFVIEEAFYEDLPANGGIGSSPGVQYAGLWSTIQTVSGATFTTGSQVVVHVQGSVWALRVRVATAAAGGTLTAWAYGN